MPPPVHRLDHLHRDQLVEPAGQVPPVNPEHGDAVGQPGLGHPTDPHTERCASEMVVVVTRQPNRVAAWTARPPQPEPTSTRWSVGTNSSLAQIRSILAHLCFGQRDTRAIEHGARIGHGLVQHEGEEVVGEVVVIGDVPLVLVPTRRGQASRDVENRGPRPPQPIQAAPASGRVSRARARTNAVRSSAVPPAGHVRGPQADRGRSEQCAVGAAVVHRHPGHGLTPAQPERLAAPR